VEIRKRLDFAHAPDWGLLALSRDEIRALVEIAEATAATEDALLRPDFLSGEDGEVVFVPRSFAATATEARAVALREGFNVGGWGVDEVEMLPVPEHFLGFGVFDADWAVVRPGTPGAVAFWRFQC
jgi:hypothetical protein